MKDVVTVSVGSILLIVFVAFSLFQGGFLTGITGLAVSDIGLDGEVSINESVVNITEEIASEAILDAEDVIKIMQDNNFSTFYVNDLLREAKIVFEQAKYADILRDTNSTNFERMEASSALRLVSWREIYFNDVISYTDEINDRLDWAFLLNDRIIFIEARIAEDDYGFEINDSLANVKTVFYEDRYEEAERLLDELNFLIESKQEEKLTLNVLRQGFLGFFRKYWVFILIGFVFILIGSYFFYKRVEKDLLKNRVRKMKAEREVITHLIKKTQVDRFKKNIISDIVYKIRTKHYQDKINSIKQELPILESNLRKLEKCQVSKGVKVKKRSGLNVK